jgi:hypothetical protein
MGRDEIRLVFAASQELDDIEDVAEELDAEANTEESESSKAGSKRCKRASAYVEIFEGAQLAATPAFGT